MIECNAAVRRVILDSHDIELIRLFSDVPEFRQRLHREVADETYPKLHELLRPLSDNDIDRAIQDWNGRIESKHAVVRYMKDHAREKDTAAWLAHEFDGSDGKDPVCSTPGKPRRNGASLVQGAAPDRPAHQGGPFLHPGRTGQSGRCGPHRHPGDPGPARHCGRSCGGPGKAGQRSLCSAGHAGCGGHIQGDRPSRPAGTAFFRQSACSCIRRRICCGPWHGQGTDFL